MDLQFCSELELFDNQGLAAHMKVHPKCRFCHMALYSKNEEEAHMAEHHFVCQVCLLGGQGTYFSDAMSYRNHLRHAFRRSLFLIPVNIRVNPVPVNTRVILIILAFRQHEIALTAGKDSVIRAALTAACMSQYMVSQPKMQAWTRPHLPQPSHSSHPSDATDLLCLLAIHTCSSSSFVKSSMNASGAHTSPVATQTAWTPSWLS